MRREANVFTAFGAVADTEGVEANGVEGEENKGVEFNIGGSLGVLSELAGDIELNEPLDPVTPKPLKPPNLGVDAYENDIGRN